MSLKSIVSLLGAALATALSASFVAAQATSGDEALIAQSRARYAAFVPSAAYMARTCADAPNLLYPGLPTRRCSYTNKGVRAEVTLIVPDAERLARWTVTACRDAGAANMTACARHLEKRVFEASGGQFPISGYVIEPQSAIMKGGSNAPYCMLFRDGVTVRTADITSRPPQDGRCVPASAEASAITRAFRFARVASTTREELARAPGAPPLTSLVNVAFPAAVRAEFVAAWSSARNRLFSGAAISDKQKGIFQ